MITLAKIPLNRAPLDYFKEKIALHNNRRTVAVVPTNRNHQMLMYSLTNANVWNLDIMAIAQFNSRSAVYTAPLLPKELRQYYLYKAMRGLPTEEIETMLHLDSNQAMNYLSFLKNSDALIPFYRELAAEQISFNALIKEYIYQDYELHIHILSKLKERYTAIVHSEGFIDEWESYQDAAMDSAFTSRYDTYIFLISGYLTNYEIARFNRLGQSSNVELYLNFTKASHPQEATFLSTFEVDEIIDDDGSITEWKTPIATDTISSQNANNKIFVINNRELASRSNAKIVSIMPCASSLAQYDLITSLICEEHFKHGVPLSKMAVILPDARFAPWFLYSDIFQLYNVSAGKPITLSPFYHKLLALAELLSSIDNGELPLSMAQAYISAVHLERDSLTDEIYKLTKDGRLYLSLKEIAANSTWEWLYSDIKPFLPAETTYTKLTKVIANYITEKATDDEQDMLTAALNELEKMQILYATIKEALTTTQLLQNIVADIASISTPIKKGQVAVIGLLESRNLQFDYLFVPDMNSDVFPAMQDKDVYLNSDLRKRLSLPTFADREVLQKGYLYQVVERAKKTVITYTESDKEQPSSFINELLTYSHAPIEKNNDKASSQLYEPSEYFLFSTSKQPKIKTNSKLYKTSDIISRLQTFKFSATSIASYRACQMQFFYRYLMKLRKDEEAIDDIDMRTLGNIFHHVMKELNQGSIHADSPLYLDKMNEYFDKQIDQYDYFTKNAVGIFQATALKEQFPKLVEHERSRMLAGERILYVEKPLTANLFDLKFSGQMDRIDSSASGITIIDYKYKKLDPAKSYDFQKIDLQLPIYAMMYEAQFKAIPKETLFFDLKNSAGFLSGFDMACYDEFKSDFEEFIYTDLLAEGEFTGAKDEHTCKYCDFATFCPHFSESGDS